MVTVNGKSKPFRNSKSGETSTWKKYISLIDAFAFFVKSIRGFGKHITIFDMFSYHKNSVIAFYDIVRVLCLVIQRCHSCRISGFVRLPGGQCGTASDPQSEQ